MTSSDPLTTEIARLWRLLGDVVEEQAGAELRRIVERTRRRSIRARAGDTAARRLLELELDGLDAGRAEVVIRAFLLHFRLGNLAEERHRVRVLEQRGRRPKPGVLDDTLAGVIRSLRAAGQFPGRRRRGRRPSRRAPDPPCPDGPPDRGASADGAHGPGTGRPHPRGAG